MLTYAKSSSLISKFHFIHFVQAIAARALATFTATD
jgi:hypothetical protein